MAWSCAACGRPLGAWLAGRFLLLAVTALLPTLLGLGIWVLVMAKPATMSRWTMGAALLLFLGATYVLIRFVRRLHHR